METLLTIVFVFFGALFAAGFTRALTAKLMTGKWPHQSEESKDIFDSLP